MFPIVALFSDAVSYKKQLRIENRYHSYGCVLREVCAEAEEAVDQRGSMWKSIDEGLMDPQCL
jgi:hypothetical protein